MSRALALPLRPIAALLVAVTLCIGGGGATVVAVDLPPVAPTPVVASTSAAEASAAAASAAASPTVAQLVGQKLVIAMAGTTPSASLLGRIGRGEVGGIVLFGDNIGGAASLRALTARLQAAAAAGGQPPLLIATDQEGGSVKRVPWAPPTLSPPAMGALDSTATATSQGTGTGYVLRCAGINADLAPVADVPASASSFMAREGRTWSPSATVTASLADAFASGLEAGGSVPVMKHFPGIGDATQNTDAAVVTINATRAQLAPGLRPYQAAISHGLPVVMLSNATYPAYDASNAAGWSTEIGTGLLRTTLGFTGVTVTDSLSGTAAARGVSATSLALAAAKSGTDMLMLTGSESSTASTYASLLAAAMAGTLPLATLRASHDRILALKATLKPAVADAVAPAVSAPVSRIPTGTSLGAGTARVRTNWSAKDPCRIAGSWLERSTNGGAWRFQPLPTTLSRAVTQTLALGSTYRYAAKATDGAGNRSAWRFARTLRPLLSEQTRAAVHFGGTWSTVTSSAYSGGSIRWSSTPGARVTYTFTASDVGWVGALGPTRGSAAVYLDGVRKATVNLYSATVALRRVVFAAHWSRQGTHTIRIVVIGTVGHPRVDVDAFVRLYRP